jgi:hypothetical protein
MATKLLILCFLPLFLNAQKPVGKVIDANGDTLILVQLIPVYNNLPPQNDTMKIQMQPRNEMVDALCELLVFFTVAVSELPEGRIKEMCERFLKSNQYKKLRKFYENN